MGDHEGWAPPSGLLPGEAVFVTRPLDRERWAIAEERTAELIARIQPNRLSEQRRNAVVRYVQGLIHKCFSCRVFTFGSVPLKTYLPDGDIDLSLFSKHQNLNDTWAKEICNVLESEEKREYAEFHVKEVHYIQAEVKIIKCLVENIVVDISFNQLGGLCTLCFLEKVDHLIGQNHLFKRSIILVKAWCYYESRVLGAHHGLISTYALETLVLYIFNVFNNSISGPLEVLYRFLAFFSNFDWESYCVSLSGPIPLSLLPEMAEEPPRKDGGELLLNKKFLDACIEVYGVFPVGHDNQSQCFVSKHFNVVDPLRTNNNLGRSVNKGNFFRIRSAFGFGARQLARILECPNKNIVSEIDQFFMNTWDRHGRGQRPDAPSPDLWHLQPAQPDSVDDDEENKGKPPGQAQNISDHMLSLNIQDDGSKGVQGTPSSLTGLLTHSAENYSLASPLDQGSLSTKAVLSSVSRGGNSKSTSSKSHHQHASTWASAQSSEHLSEIACTTKNQKGFKGDISGSESEDKLRFHFARPRSSPDLTGVPNETTSRGRRSRGETIEALKNLDASRLEHSPVDHRRKNKNSDCSSSYTSKPTVTSDSLALRRSSSQESIGTGNFSESSNYSNSLSSTKQSPCTSLPLQREEATQSDEIMETIVPPHHDGQDPVNLMGFQRPPFVNRVIESTWTGAAGRVSKLPKEKRGRVKGNNVEFSNSKQRETISSYGKSNSGWQTEPTMDHPFIGDEAVNQDLHSFGSANADSLNHGDQFSSSLHGSKSSIPPQPSESALPAHMTVRNIGPISSALHVQPTSVSGYDSGSSMSSDSVIPGGNFSPVVMGQGSRQSAMDNGGVLPFTFYPTGPPFPFVAMLPLYTFPTDGGSSGDLPSPYDSMGASDDSIDNHVDQPEHSIDTSLSYDLGECSEQTDIFSSSNAEPGDGLFVDHQYETKSDILHSDINSHWQNLQYGRDCQNPHLNSPMFYPSLQMLFPQYLQGHFPWDGPGRPLPANMSMLTPLVGYGHRFVPVSALQPNSSRPVGNFQHLSGPNRLYGEELPRYRSGTGTYLPNPRQVPYRERQSSGSRGNRGNYGQDRNDNGDRDAGWVFIPKNRGGGRGQNKYDGRNQNEKSNSRVERNSEGKGGERGWDSYRHGNLRRGSYQAQHAPFASGNSSVNTGNVMPQGSGGTPYGVYPLQSMNTNGNVPSIPGNGPAVPSVVMLYPYDHNMGFPPEPLEFGSLGPVQLGGSQEGRFNEGAARLNDGRYYEQKHNSYQTNASPGHSPLDQPSSPKQHQRSSTQRSYQLKDEDFPPLSFRNQSGRGGSNSFNIGNNSNSRSSHYQAFLVTPSS